MLMLKVALALSLLSLLTSFAAADQTEFARSKADKTCTPESLQGRYLIVSGEKEGAKEPEERLKGITVAFTKDSVVVADGEKHEIYSATYKLDATTHPCAITMTSRVESFAGQIARGLIQKDGDTVRLIYALPEGEIPSAFKTKEKQLLFVMKKAE